MRGQKKGRRNRHTLGRERRRNLIYIPYINGRRRADT